MQFVHDRISQLITRKRVALKFISATLFSMYAPF